MNWSAAEADEVPAGVVTVTSTAPLAVAGGLVTVSWVSPATARFVAATVPKRTPVALVKPLPVTVTGVSPASGPVAGLTPVTTGAGTGAFPAGPAS